jgi:hypothetical protein
VVCGWPKEGRLIWRDRSHPAQGLKSSAEGAKPPQGLGFQRLRPLLGFSRRLPVGGRGLRLPPQRTALRPFGIAAGTQSGRKCRRTFGAPASDGVRRRQTATSGPSAQAALMLMASWPRWLKAPPIPRPCFQRAPYARRRCASGASNSRGPVVERKRGSFLPWQFGWGTTGTDMSAFHR